MKKGFPLWGCLLLLLILSACKAPQQPQGPSASAGPSVSPTVSPTASLSPSPTGETSAPTASLYSSYAYMVSFDPSTGKAKFDYFDMLRGKEAIQWLVQQESYTQAAAKEKVDNFADSEFIEKNVNKQLRTIDLKTVPLQLMYTADGKLVSGAESIKADIDDLKALYAKNKDAVLKTHFYYIQVKSGKVVLVNQVYWP